MSLADPVSDSLNHFGFYLYNNYSHRGSIVLG